MQNGYIERLKGSMRREMLNAYVFNTFSEVRNKVSEWVKDYNLRRPHKSLVYLTYRVPRITKKDDGKLKKLTFEWHEKKES